MNVGIYYQRPVRNPVGRIVRWMTSHSDTTKEALTAADRTQILTVETDQWIKYVEAANFGDILVIKSKELDEYASVKISAIPSQCGMVLWHDWHIDGDEATQQLLSYAEDVSKALGYSTVMATLVSEHKIDILKDDGFMEVKSFVNQRSGNRVSTLIKELEYEDYNQGR